MEYIYCIIIGYFIGSINPSFFLGKRQGVDIRKKGSGNAGASNVIILFGALKGAFCAVFDITKAMAAIAIANTLFPDFEHVLAVTGTACILGHIFPFYMKFRGGKGLACLGGMVLIFDIRVFVIMLISAVIVALITDYICFVPVCASAVFPIVYAAITKDGLGALILGIAAVVMFIKHIENFKRIKAGIEMHFSFLWNKNAEFERIQKSADADNEEMEDRFLKAK